MNSNASDSLSRRLVDVFLRLDRAYGPQNWWPGSGGFEMIAGAILTQSAAWTNVERALANLRRAGALEPAKLLAFDEAELALLVRPSGYYLSKARKLRAFARLLVQEFNGDPSQLFLQPMEVLRNTLLSTYGIGPETADDIILYGANQPSFVIDAYTRRVFTRLGVEPHRDRYEDWRSLFMSNLPANAALFNQYHALIVCHAKRSCSKRPRCSGCTLASICPSASPARSRHALQP